MSAEPELTYETILAVQQKFQDAKIPSSYYRQYGFVSPFSIKQLNKLRHESRLPRRSKYHQARKAKY